MALFGNKNVFTPVAPAPAPAPEELPELDFLKERAAAQSAPAPAIPEPAPAAPAPSAPAYNPTPSAGFAPAAPAASSSAIAGFTPTAPAFTPLPVGNAPAGLDFVDHPVIPAKPREQAPAFIATPVPQAETSPKEIKQEAPQTPFVHDTALDDYEWELAEPAQKEPEIVKTSATTLPLSKPVSAPARPEGFVASPSAKDPVVASVGAAAPIRIQGLSIPTQYSPLVLSGGGGPVITVSRLGLMSYIAKDSLRCIIAYGDDEYDALSELFRQAGRDMGSFSPALPPMPGSGM